MLDITPQKEITWGCIWRTRWQVVTTPTIISNNPILWHTSDLIELFSGWYSSRDYTWFMSKGRSSFTRYCFHVIWCGRSSAALSVCRRLVERGVTVTSSVLCVWIGYVFWHTRSSYSFPFDSIWNFLQIWLRVVDLHHLLQSEWNIDKWTKSFEEKFDVIRQLEKGEQTVDMSCVGLARSSICTVGYNADRLTVSTKSGSVGRVAQLV